MILSCKSLILVFILLQLCFDAALALRNCNYSLSYAEYHALFDLYNSTNGPNWAWRPETEIFGKRWSFSANLTEPLLSAPCINNWQGITCSKISASNCTVSSLSLSAYEMTGTLPNSLSSLQNLRELNFQSNRLRDMIPSSLGQLSQLISLQLGFNFFRGTIPSSLGMLSLLQELRLSANGLGDARRSVAASIPSSFGGLHNLTLLALDRNHFTGSIPSSIGNLSFLETLSLQLNHFTSSIPSSLLNMRDLVVLELYGNFFTGTIPSFIGDMLKLKRLDLGYNDFTGSIPSSVGNLVHLETMILSFNFIMGTIPSSLGQITQLLYLNLFFNSLTGTLPPSLGNLSRAYLVDLGHNALTGAIPSSFGQLSALKALLLYSNSLSGTIPTALGQLNALLFMVIQSNRLVGPFPSSLCMPQLHLMYLSLNSLTGTIPSTFGRMSLLRYLNINSNSLTGTIPTCLGQIARLEYLYLNSNSLTGNIPPSLGNATRLHSLYLNNNALTGSIPSAMGQLLQLKTMYLSSNAMTGTLPPSIGNLVNLNLVYLSSNHFSGTFPAAWSRLIRMFQFSVSNNMVTGGLLHIFIDGTQFRELSLLDFSYNGFSGSFPVGVFTFQALLSLSATSNCFSGSLNITDLPARSNLQKVYMDGLSSGMGCRRLSLAPLAKVLYTNPNPGYVPNNLMSGPIPSSLFSLPNIKLITMDGNGFQGPIDMGSFDYLTSNLSHISLTYNRLSGSIPQQLQTSGRLKHLDLAYNRLSGILDSDFTFDVTTSMLNISVNYLSGPLPTANTNLMSASDNLVGTVLNGNLFQFDISKVEESQQGVAVTYDGSWQFDVAMIVAAVLWFWCVLAGIAVVLVMQGRITSPVLTGLLENISHWWIASTHLLRRRWLHSRRLLVLFRIIVGVAVAMLVVATLLTVVYLSVKTNPNYAVYVYQYAWTWSTMYVKGGVSAALILTLISAALVVYFTTFFPLKKEIPMTPTGTGPESDPVSGTGSSTGAAATRISAAVMAISTLILLTDAVIMVLMNALYLKSLNNKFVSLFQMLLASVKFVMSKLAYQLLAVAQHLPTVLSILSPSSTSFSSSSDAAASTTRTNVSLFFGLSVLLINYIIAPSITTAISDPSCFSELFQQNSGLPNNENTFLCADEAFFIEDGHVTFSCVDSVNSTGLKSGLVSAEQEATFVPPFVYNYQCSSALINNYVPVLIYIFLISGVVMPVVKLTLMQFPELVRQCLPLWMRQLCIPPIYLIEEDIDSTAQTETVGTEHSTSMRKGHGHSKAGDVMHGDHNGGNDGYHDGDRGLMAVVRRLFMGSISGQVQLFNYASMIDHLILESAVVLTFGLAAPFLALVVVSSMLSEMLFIRLLMGRYVHLQEASAQHRCGMADRDTHSRELQDLSHWSGSEDPTSPTTRARNVACNKLDDTCERGYLRHHMSSYTTVMLAVIFWGFVCFDVIGYEQDDTTALTTSIAWVVGAPLMVYWVSVGFLLLHHRLGLRNFHSLLSVITSMRRKRSKRRDLQERERERVNDQGCHEGRHLGTGATVSVI